jgi:hypothetical protein
MLDGIMGVKTTKAGAVWLSLTSCPKEKYEDIISQKRAIVKIGRVHWNTTKINKNGLSYAQCQVVFARYQMD